MDLGKYLKKKKNLKKNLEWTKYRIFPWLFSKKRTVLAAVFQKYFPITVISLTKFLLKSLIGKS